MLQKYWTLFADTFQISPEILKSPGDHMYPNPDYNYKNTHPSPQKIHYIPLPILWRDATIPIKFKNQGAALTYIRLHSNKQYIACTYKHFKIPIPTNIHITEFNT